MSLNELLNTSIKPWANVTTNNLTVQSNLTVDGNALVDGNLQVNGTINGSGGPIGPISSSLVPMTDNVYNLGSNPPLEQWQNLYLGNVANFGAVSNQIVLSSNSADPTTINVPTMAQATVLTVPDPGTATGNIMVVDSANLVHPNVPYNFPSSVFSASAPVGSGTSLNAPVVNVQGATGNLVFTHNGGNATVISSTVPAAPSTYNIPDVGASGSFVVADSSDNITVNQLNYTTLNPPVSSGFTAREYLYSITTPQVLGSGGSEAGILFNNIISQNAAGDVSQDVSDFSNYHVNNTGLYLCTFSINDATGNLTSIGGSWAIGSGPRYGQVLSGSDANQPGAVSSTVIQIITGGTSIFPLVRSTSTSAGDSIGGTGVNTGFLSIIRIA